MPRNPRVQVEGGIYHVYNRIIDGVSVFESKATSQSFLDLLREIKTRDRWTLFAWCLMGNHYHLVLRTGVAPLSRGMRCLDGRLSQIYNHHHRRVGPLWQHRYKNRLVSNEHYLRQVILYVHLNPVRAGLTDKPNGYPMSGHRELMGSKPTTLADSDHALLVFGQTVRSGQRSYAASMRAAGASDRLTRDVEWKLWKEEEERTLSPPVISYVDELGRSTGLSRQKMTADRFVEVFCDISGYSFARLAGKCRDRETASGRRLLATLGIERWGQRAIDLSTIINKNPDVVSHWAAIGSLLQTTNRQWASRVNQLDEKMAVQMCPREHQ